MASTSQQQEPKVRRGSDGVTRYVTTPRYLQPTRPHPGYTKYWAQAWPPLPDEQALQAEEPAVPFNDLQSCAIRVSELLPSIRPMELLLCAAHKILVREPNCLASSTNDFAPLALLHVICFAIVEARDYYDQRCERFVSTTGEQQLTGRDVDTSRWSPELLEAWYRGVDMAQRARNVMLKWWLRGSSRSNSAERAGFKEFLKSTFLYNVRRVYYVAWGVDLFPKETNPGVWGPRGDPLGMRPTVGSIFSGLFARMCSSDKES